MSKRSKEQILKSYMKLIDFFADYLGENYEIVLHDIDKVEHSIVYIRNNFSGRNIGGALTDFGLKILKEKQYVNGTYIANYKSKTHEGKVIRSATYYINDDDNKLIALLCINYDATKANSLRIFLDKLIGEDDAVEINKYVSNSQSVSENLYDTVEEVAYQIMNDVISRYPVSIERMTLDEKKGIISEVDKKGFFLVKGSVKAIANRLDISETTVYRIINSGQNAQNA